MSRTSHDQFLGRYRAETVPMWDLVEVARKDKGYVLLLRTPADTQTIALQTGSTTLQGRHTDEACTGYIMVSLDEETRRPVISIRLEAEDEQIQEQIPEVVRFHQIDPPTPLTVQGVNAADLVQQVRDSEQWIHQVQSLRWLVRTNWVYTPESLALRERNIKREYPEDDVSNRRFWGLVLEQPGTFFLSMDGARLRWRSEEDQRFIRDHLWDGHTFYYYEKHFTHTQEQICIHPTLGQNASFIFSSMAWPRAQHHRFWWQTDLDGCCAQAYPDEATAEHDPIQEAFTLTGQESYRGTACYVLDCAWTGVRWYVGITDGLLYGQKHYNLAGLVSHHWTEDYREVRPGWWFPMQQGYGLFEEEHGQAILCGERRLIIDEIEVDQCLPEEDFEMTFKEGVRTVDFRFGGIVGYPYKESRSIAEWEEIRLRAQQRQEEDDARERQWEDLRGQRVPDFPVSSQWLNSAPLTWENLRGQTVVLLFWSHTCAPCRNHIAEMKAWKRKGPPVIVGVHSPATDLEAVRTLLDTYHANGPVCVDVPRPPGGMSFGQLSSQLRVPGVPCWVVIGPDSSVVGHSLDSDRAYEMARNASGV